MPALIEAVHGHARISFHELRLQYLHIRVLRIHSAVSEMPALAGSVSGARAPFDLYSIIYGLDLRIKVLICRNLRPELLRGQGHAFKMYAL